MNNLRHLLALLLALFAISFAASAHAAPCYAYDVDDTVTSGWTQWNSGTAITESVGYSSLALSPSDAATFTVPATAPLGEWGIIWKNFSIFNYTRSGVTPGNPCGVPTSPIPEPVTYVNPPWCWAGLALKVTSGYVAGSIQMVNPSTNTYIATQSFSQSAASPLKWVYVAAASTTGCVRNTQVRIEFDRTGFSGSAIVDDVTVEYRE